MSKARGSPAASKTTSKGPFAAEELPKVVRIGLRRTRPSSAWWSWGLSTSKAASAPFSRASCSRSGRTSKPTRRRAGLAIRQRRSPKPMKPHPTTPITSSAVIPATSTPLTQQARGSRTQRDQSSIRSGIRAALEADVTLCSANHPSPSTATLPPGGGGSQQSQLLRRCRPPRARRRKGSRRTTSLPGKPRYRLYKLRTLGPVRAHDSGRWGQLPFSYLNLSWFHEAQGPCLHRSPLRRTLIPNHLTEH